ncbi:hypothetical protein ACTMTJ_40895 [Phytohabitans sp. LJ34]|uniref:hypothetical protein n=1 Tax=Phytohabitans sp. LJ34 TaxID=3452217 RepID=UPI003F889763
MGIALTDQARVELHSLAIGPEDDGVQEVGRPETGVFIALPAEGIRLLSWLDSGFTLGEVRRRFTAIYGVAPELDEFVTGLLDCGFVKAVDGTATSPAAAESAGRGWRLLASLPQHRVAWILAPPMRLLYAGVWLAVPVLFVLRPDLIPHAANALLDLQASLNLLLLVLLVWVMLFLHELAHMLAARARGCVASLSISRRLYFLVAQTDMSGIRAVPRRERYAPYLAGMTFDLAVLLACTALRMAGVGGGVPTVIAYIVGAQIAYQFAIFLRTDLYFVLTNWLRTGNLTQDVQAILNDRWRRSRGKARLDLSGIPARERRIARLYLPFYVLGIAAAIANLVFYVLPVLAGLVMRAVSGLLGHDGVLSRWDGIAFLIVNAVHFGLLGMVFYRERRVSQARKTEFAVN